jgi:hypothetical protein
MREAYARVLSCRAEFSPDGWTMRWVASSPMSGFVVGGSVVVLPAGAAYVQVSSCRAEFS